MRHTRTITRAPKRAQAVELNFFEQVLATLTKGQSVKLVP